ncbi:hypothetical protein TrRE_jg9098, partial [Triparma retinervis]
GLTPGLVVPQPINTASANTNSGNLSIPSVVLIGVFVPLGILMIILGSYWGGKKTATVAFAKMQDEQEGGVEMNSTGGGNTNSTAAPPQTPPPAGMKADFEESQMSPGPGNAIGNEESLSHDSVMDAPPGSEIPDFDGEVITGPGGGENTTSSPFGNGGDDEVFHEVGESGSGDML